MENRNSVSTYRNANQSTKHAKFHVISPRNVCPHEAATTILVKIFWNFNILVQVRFTTSKTKLYIYYSKLGRRVASRVASHLRKSRNIRKISNLVGDKGQPTLKKFDLGSSSQNHAEMDMKPFSPCPILRNSSILFQILWSLKLMIFITFKSCDKKSPKYKISKQKMAVLKK